MKNEKFKDIINVLYINRDPRGIKSDFGRSLLIGGSRKYPGAIVISSLLASVTGNGYTAIAVPDSIYSSVSAKVPATQIFELLSERESFTLKETTNLDRCLSLYDSILFGNGIESSKENYDFMDYVLHHYHGSLVLDATALFLLAQYGSEILDNNTCEKVLLTPHLGEASALIGQKKGRDVDSYYDVFLSYARKHHVNVLLKGYASALITDSGDILTSDYEPCAALGKAGSGDGLAGYITGLLAYARKHLEFEEVVLFADQMIHLAAATAAEEQSAGIASILSVPEKIKEIIINSKL